MLIDIHDQIPVDAVNQAAKDSTEVMEARIKTLSSKGLLGEKSSPVHQKRQRSRLNLGSAATVGIPAPSGGNAHMPVRKEAKRYPHVAKIAWNGIWIFVGICFLPSSLRI